MASACFVVKNMLEETACSAVTLWLIHDYSVKEFNGGGIGLLFKYSGKEFA